MKDIDRCMSCRGVKSVNDLNKRIDRLEAAVRDLQKVFHETAFRQEAEKKPLMPIGDGTGSLYCGNHIEERVCVGRWEDGTTYVLHHQCPVCGRMVDWG